MAREAGEEPDTAQAQHFLSVAEYWLQLADEAELSQAAPKRECPA